MVHAAAIGLTQPGTGNKTCTLDTAADILLLNVMRCRADPQLVPSATQSRLQMAGRHQGFSANKTGSG
jgi:hypothetical protein